MSGNNANLKLDGRVVRLLGRLVALQSGSKLTALQTLRDLRVRPRFEAIGLDFEQEQDLYAANRPAH